MQIDNPQSEKNDGNRTFAYKSYCTKSEKLTNEQKLTEKF